MTLSEIIIITFVAVEQVPCLEITVFWEYTLCFFRAIVVFLKETIICFTSLTSTKGNKKWYLLCHFSWHDNFIKIMMKGSREGKVEEEIGKGISHKFYRQDKIKVNIGAFQQRACSRQTWRVLHRQYDVYVCIQNINTRDVFCTWKRTFVLQLTSFLNFWRQLNRRPVIM